jgi:hypothetical protein
MATDIVSPIGAPAAVHAAQAPPQAAGTTTDDGAFRRLLESLERLTKAHREQPPPADAEQLQQAIRAVDDSFVTAMDLRQKLEAAFASRST